MNLLIRNGRIIDPSQGIDCIGDVLISDGKIGQIGGVVSVSQPEISVFDADGMIVCPGFFDMHCHLRQPGFEEKETIATGTDAAAAGGFATVCCMPNTDPPIAKPAVIEQVILTSRKEGRVRVLPIACVTEGRRGEKLADLAALAEAGAVAFSDDGSPVHDSEIMRQALECSKSLGLPIIDHCEDLSLSGDGSMNEGEVSRKLGYRGIPDVAEERMVERDIELARQTGGRLHIAHVSTAGSVEVIRQAKRQGVGVTAEATPHHLTLTEEMVAIAGAAAKVNPPLRTEQDRKALLAGLGDGTIDAIATDHAPHAMTDKDCDFGKAAFGISGSETALGGLMMLVHRGELDLTTMISKLTAEPTRLLGKSELGNLNSGSMADITVFDPNAQWTVEPDRFASKGRNTPLAGAVLKGMVKLVIVNGNIAFDSR